MKSTVERLDLLLADLKENFPSSTYTYMVLILFVLFFGAILAFYIKYGYFGRILFYAGALLIAGIYYRRGIKESIAHMHAVSNYGDPSIIGEKQYLSNKLVYLKAGIEIKRVRIVIIKWIYFILFPLFLLLMSELFIGKISGVGDFIWKYIVAIIIGGLIWLQFFNKELEIIYGYEDDALILGRKI